MGKRYSLRFKLFNEEWKAKLFCENENVNASRYIRNNKPAHYTPWSSCDVVESGFVAWYWR